MATAPTDPNKLNQQPSSDITSSVNKFAGDVGAGAYNVGRGYVDWSEKPLRDQPLSEVAVGTLFGTNTPEAGWGEFYRRVDEEPGKIVGEVGAEVGLGVATAGVGKAVIATKYGAKAAGAVAKAKGAAKAKVATATRGVVRKARKSKSDYPIDRNIQTRQDIEKITGKSITDLNREIDIAKARSPPPVTKRDILPRDSLRSNSDDFIIKKLPPVTKNPNRSKFISYESIRKKIGTADGFTPPTKKEIMKERARDIAYDKRVGSGNNRDIIPRDDLRMLNRYGIVDRKTTETPIGFTDLGDDVLRPGLAPTQSMNVGGRGFQARRRWPAGSFEDKISRMSDRQLLRKFGEGQGNTITGFSFDVMPAGRIRGLRGVGRSKKHWYGKKGGKNRWINPFVEDPGVRALPDRKVVKKVKQYEGDFPVISAEDIQLMKDIRKSELSARARRDAGIKGGILGTGLVASGVGYGQVAGGQKRKSKRMGL